MQKKFVTNLALLLFLNLLVKPFWIFGIDRTVQNTVGPDEYGVYMTLFNFSFLLNILLDLGINNWNNRNIAQHKQLVTKHLSKIFTIRVLLLAGYLGVTMIAGWSIGYSERYMGLLLIFGFNQFLTLMVLYLRSNLAGLHLFRTDSLISVLDRTLLIIICAVLLWGNVTDQVFRIEWFVYSQTVAYGITVLVAFVALMRKVDHFRPKFDLPFSLSILKQSLPYSVIIVLMIIYYKVDAVMLERMLPDGPTQVGVYAQAFRMLDAAHMIAYLYGGLMLPIFARMLSNKEPMGEMVGLSVRLLVGPALVIATCCWFYQEEIIATLYPTGGDLAKEAIGLTAAPILGVLMIAFVPIAFSYIFGTLLTANGNMRYLNWMGVVGVVLNVALNWFLIPRLEAYGAALASLITQLVTVTGQVLIARHLFKLRMDLKLAGTLLVFVGGLIGMGFGLDALGWGWPTNFFVFAGGGAVWALATGTIGPRMLLRILRQDESQKAA